MNGLARGRVRRGLAVARLVLVFLLFATAEAGAVVLDFDFARTKLGRNPLSNLVVAGEVRAEAFIYAGGRFTSTLLWQRNRKNDHGLGVCSEGRKSCKRGKGDVNEISDQVNPGLLRLTLPDGKCWAGLWVSSLDSGSSGGSELGTLYWSDLAQPDLSALTGFSFQFGDFGTAVEGDLVALPGLAAAGFDSEAKHLFFRAGPNPAGTNNDYLVWGGNLAPVPEPSSLASIIIGLAAVVGLYCRRAAARLTEAPSRVHQFGSGAVPET